MKRKFVMILLAVMTASVLTGCGKSDTKEPETKAATETVTEAETTEAVTETETTEAVTETETTEAVTEEETTEAVTEAETVTEKAEKSTEGKEAALEDGIYSAEFDTDSGMFHANEACEGKGVLTVKDGEMTFHVSLVSKNIVSLFVGKAEDAKKDGAQVLEPTLDTVTYSDGDTEEVFGFDIPISAVDEEFDLALLGTKGTWYDHVVSVTNPEKTE